MPLHADITIRLDASTLVGVLVSNLAGSSGALGAIATPNTGSATGNITNTAAGFNAASLGPAISALVVQAGSGLGAIVPQTNLLGGIGNALTLIEKATHGNLRAEIEALITQLTRELEGSREGGTFAVLMRLSQLLANSAQGGLLATLAQTVLGAAGVNTPPAVGRLSSLLPAVDALVRAVGGLMMLETVLSESQRLTGVMAQRLDAGAVQRQVEQLMALLTPALAARIVASAVDDEAELDALVNAVRVAADQLGRFQQELGAGMGLGEATLAYLNVGQVQAEVASAAALLRNIDLSPLERQLQQALGGLAPFMAFDFASAPAQSLNGLLTQAETEIANFAGKINDWNPAELVAPLQAGIRQLTAPLADLSRLIEQAMVGIRAALDAVKRVIVDLPVQGLVSAVNTLLAPITQALQLITQLVADVAAALGAAATAAVEALGEVEGLVDGFKAEVQALFADARQFVAGLNLDAVAGTLADRIGEFTQAVAQAELKPYFDTAVQAIDAAAGVVEAVPFGLLPESMKADVDAAVAPIKAVDLAAFETQVEGFVGIGPDGRFTPREDLVAAIAQIQHKFDELIAALHEHDPEQYLAQLDAKLSDLATQIRAIAPAVTLQPVQDVINGIKAQVAAFDLAAQLAPLQAVFDDAIAAMQAYSPAQLIAPLQARVLAARQQVTQTLLLDQWAGALDTIHERAASVLSQIDPAQLETKLTELLSQARDLSVSLPDVNMQWLGSIVAAWHRGSGARIHPAAFTVVQGWIDLRAGAAALAARSSAIADAVARTHAAVSGINVAALAGELLARTQAIRTALLSLQATLPGDSRHRPALAALTLRLDVQVSMGQLVANRDRYLATLTSALTLGETLRRTGLSEVDNVVTQLHQTFAPLNTLLGSLRALLRAAGVPAVDAGVPQMLRGLFQVAPPARLAALSAPLFVALRTRVLALIDAVIVPLQAAITQLQTLINAFDLAPLQTAVNEVFQGAVAELQALSPSTLLAAPLASVNSLKAEVAAFNPLQPVLTVLDALRDTAARVLGKLSAQQLLADPLAIYREIVDALDALNVQALMTPVLDLLDSIAHDVDAGLDNTVTAFQRLQDALPSGGGGSSVTVDVSL